MIYKFALEQTWVNKSRAICTAFIYTPPLFYKWTPLKTWIIFLEVPALLQERLKELSDQ